MGRNDFEGELSQRVYSLAAKGEAFQRLAEHPRIVALLDRVLLPNCLLSTLQSIRLHPGENAQAWHTDDAFYLVPRPRASTLGVSVIWAIEDFTADNGATQVIPGSHRWGSEHPDDRAHEVVSAVMPAGSAIVFDGALWHRGGENRSAGHAPRDQPAVLPAVPAPAGVAAADRAARGRARVHRRACARCSATRSIRRSSVRSTACTRCAWSTTRYRLHKTEDHRIADEVLARPEARMTAGPRH